VKICVKKGDCMGIVLETKLPMKKFKKGKVRDVYEAGNMLLIVATDRISAFDVVLPNGIPFKGSVLNMISSFWFDLMKKIVPNHIITTESTEIITKADIPKEYEDMLKNRSMLVRKTKPLPVECVVRGYLAGSGWKEYREKGSICGIKLPEGMKQSQRIPFPIFTPSTKADTGHDQNIAEEKMMEIVGEKAGRELKEKSLKIYEAACDYAEERGIIIADTKFEFGKTNGDVLLIDEVLTPDSSRFWSKEGYAPGRSQDSFDKQFVRDWLESVNWNKQPPAPRLPDDVVKKTSEKYLEAYRRITGRTLS